MNKQRVIKCFGGTVKLSRLLGISSQAISMWPDDLPLRRLNEIVGAAHRAGMSDVVESLSAEDVRPSPREAA